MLALKSKYLVDNVANSCIRQTKTNAFRSAKDISLTVIF
jgi:hypothetical protein